MTFQEITAIISKFIVASVAQSVVHLTRNEKVACSSQVTSSIKTPGINQIPGVFSYPPVAYAFTVFKIGLEYALRFHIVFHNLINCTRFIPAL